MKMVKQPNGLYTLKDTVIWTAGRFRGFGSPAEGDVYSDKDLKQMVRSHYEVNPDPRFYYGHPLNPTLALLAKPKGSIDDMRVTGGKIIANIYDVPEKTAHEAINDNVRLSPDMKMNYLDPATGKTHKWLITGLAMLGAKVPGNKLIPALGDQLQLDPSKFYVDEAHNLSRSYAAHDMRSFVLDFSGRFPAADPNIIAARQRLALPGVRSFALDEPSRRNRNVREGFLESIFENLSRRR